MTKTDADQHPHQIATNLPWARSQESTFINRVDMSNFHALSQCAFGHDSLVFRRTPKAFHSKPRFIHFPGRHNVELTTLSLALQRDRHVSGGSRLLSPAGKTARRPTSVSARNRDPGEASARGYPTRGAKQNRTVGVPLRARLEKLRKTGRRPATLRRIGFGRSRSHRFGQGNQCRLPLDRRNAGPASCHPGRAEPIR